MKSISNYIKETRYLLGDDSVGIFHLVLLFILLSSLDLLGISLILPFVTLIINPNNISEVPIISNFLANVPEGKLFNYLGLGLIFVFLIKSVLGILINRYVTIFCFKKSVNIRTSLMRSYQQLPYLIYTLRNSSEYIHNINLADKFAGQTLAPILKIFSEGIVIIVIVTFLAFQDLTILLLVVITLLPIAVLYDLYFKPLLLSYGKISNKSSTKIVKSINEGIRGLKEIRILKKEKYFFNLMRSSAKEYADVSVKSEIISVLPRYLMEFILIFIFVTAIFIYSFKSQDIINFLPTLSLFAIASIRLTPGVNQIIIGLNKVRYSRDAVKLLYRDLNNLERYGGKSVNEKSEFNEEFQSLVLKNISFQYPSRKDFIFENVNVSISKGDFIGIVGPSGSGKSTFVNLLLGLINPTNGEIKLNNEKLEKRNLSKFSNYVGYLPQDVFLVDDTIMNNIALGVNSELIDKEKVLYCIKQVKLDKLIEQLNEGIFTSIGENGVQLSGGQKQRVAIARAIYYEKDILILDESTSALDNETEAEIMKEINSLKGKKTIIMIAHRMSSLSSCDKIIKVENSNVNITDIDTLKIQ